LNIVDKTNKTVYSELIPFENLPNSNSISFFNSIGLLQNSKGLFIKDFISKKEVYLTRDRYNEEMAIGKYNPDLSGTDFIVYDRFLNPIKSISLKSYTEDGKFWSMLYDQVKFQNNKIGLVLNYPLLDGQANYQRKTDVFNYDMLNNIFSPSLTIDEKESYSTNKCPENFKEIKLSNVTGTARKYTAKDGHKYYEVKLTINPSLITKKYTTKITANRLRKYTEQSYGVTNIGRIGGESGINKTGYFINSSSGTISFLGCYETDVFQIEGNYQCETGRFKGPSVTIYFRDLKIIQ